MKLHITIPRGIYDKSSYYLYKSDISYRPFILQFQRPETGVNLVSAHSIDINNSEERDMLRAFTVALANLKSLKENKTFRPICRAAMLNLNAGKIIAKQLKQLRKESQKNSGLLAFFS